MDAAATLAQLLDAARNSPDNGAGIAWDIARKVEASPGFLADPQQAGALAALIRDWHVRGQGEVQRRICLLLAARTHGRHAGEALHLLGVHAEAQGDFSEATAYYTRALAIRADPFSSLALAQLHLMESCFTQGFAEYEARFEAVSERSCADWRGLPYPRWNGENLQGKHIYLWAEQGLGDVVMFATLLPHLLAMQPARIALGMHKKLVTVFARSFPAIAVEDVGDAGLHALGPTVATAFPHIKALAALAPVPFSLAPLQLAYRYTQAHGLFDYAAPMGDVLRLARDVPGPAVAVLRADPELTRQLKSQLGAQRPGLLTGISWTTTNRREPHRTLPLDQWLPVLRTPGRHFVSLQHGVARHDIESFCARHGCVITVPETLDVLEDAEGLCALIAAMDDVISIDNSNVHIAGALGVPATLLLPRGHNFRWPVMKGGANLWYATVSLLRQSVNGEWGPVIDALCRRYSVS